MAESSIGMQPEKRPFIRTISSIVLFVYTAVVASPGAQALTRQVKQAHSDTVISQQLANEAKHDFGKSLRTAKHELRILAGREDVLHHKSTAKERTQTREALKTWREDLRRLDAETRADFARNAALIHDKNLPEVIKQRQADTLAKYQAQMTALNKELDDVLAAKDDNTMMAKADIAFKHLEQTQLGRTHQKFDPNHLPNRVQKADRNRKPRMSAAAFQAAGLYSNGVNGLAQVTYDLSHLASAQDPAFLQATTEVTLTDDIKAKAAALHNNPVEIYNWVRNNVQWLPTWGAIQTASHTLSSQSGNAFDIASLTIALLRASGIPARYVHGVIDVPADQFRNWAGGFQNLNAAIDFASAGGIPITTVISGGQITKIRMEHIWVEAAIDFIPSRGVKNIAADSWVAMDPSFKQIQVLPGLDAVKISGIDPNQLANNFIASGTVNESEGWATGFDPTILQSAQTQAQTSLQNYITTNLPNATVGDVLGGRKIITQTSTVLPASLPNHLDFVGARYATLPSQLEQQITFAFGKDIDGTLLNPKTFPWPQLNNQEVTLSFRPATQADQDALTALLPAGTITDLSQLPTSIPAYLVHVLPELKVNGTVVMTGDAMSLGTDLDFVFDPIFVSSGEQPFDYSLPAGSYEAIAVVAGSVNPAQIDATLTNVQTTQAILASNDQSTMKTLDRERLFGDIYESGLLAYYNDYAADSYVIGLKQRGFHQLSAGLGSYGYEPNVDTFFGIPRAIKPGGVIMNVPIVNVVETDNSDLVAKRNYTLTIGAISSALENSIPEQMFNSSTNSGAGISAVKAIALAIEAGQKIYQINQSNISLLGNIHHDSTTMREISSAISAGKIVITHTDSISVPGWAGSGYIIVDPDTGAAAWKIAGGANGGYYTLVGLAFGLLSAFAVIVASPFIAGLVGFAGIVISITNMLTLSKDLSLAYNVSRLLGTVAGLALTIILGEFVYIAFPPLFLLGIMFLALSVFVELAILIATELASLEDPPKFLIRVA